MISFRLKIGVLVIFQLTSLTLTSVAGLSSGKVVNLYKQARAKTVNSSCNFNQFFTKTKESLFTVEKKGSNFTKFQIRFPETPQ